MNTVLVYAEEKHARSTLQAILGNHIPLVITESLAQCLETLHQRAPVHQAIMDVSGMTMPAIAKAITAMLNLKPGIKITACGRNDSEERAIEAVRNGACGYFLLPIKAQELLTAIRDNHQ